MRKLVFFTFNLEGTTTPSWCFWSMLIFTPHVLCAEGLLYAVKVVWQFIFFLFFALQLLFFLVFSFLRLNYFNMSFCYSKITQNIHSLLQKKNRITSVMCGHNISSWYSFRQNSGVISFFILFLLSFSHSQKIIIT